MVEYPYTLKTGTLKEVLTKMQTMSWPPNFSLKYLKTLGYTSSNDQKIVQILRFIKFIDTAGAPTEYYKAYKTDRQNSKAILGKAIVEAYPELFSMYPDAYRKDNESLLNFFNANINAGEKVLKSVVFTFRALCEMAEFSENSEEITLPTLSGAPAPAFQLPPGKTTTTTYSQSTIAPSININIELHLPATDNYEIYDKLFASMKKHLFNTKDEKNE